MIKPEQVPDEAVAAYMNTAFDGWASPAERIAAAINAWPGMNAKAATDHVMLLNSTPALILPLPEQENSDGK